MKKYAVLSIAYVPLGFCAAAGADYLTGWSSGCAIGMVLTLIALFSTFVVAHMSMLEETAKSEQYCYDLLLAAGLTTVTGGRDWKKGCRIDPISRAVIDPS
jgi:hypothetical protein